MCCGGVADANKHWNGLIRDFYKPRVQCYVDQASLDLGTMEGEFNGANMTQCAVMAELAFTQGTETVYAETPTSDRTIVMSKMLLEKYAQYF